MRGIKADPNATVKRCSKCGFDKPLDLFGNDAKHSDNKKSRCKECLAEDEQQRLARDPEKYKAISRNWWRKNKDHKRNYDLSRRFGISSGEYAVLLALQENKCAICKQPTKQNLCVDHNHATKTNRGLLCHDCNVAFGRFKESPTIINEALKYAMKWADK